MELRQRPTRLDPLDEGVVHVWSTWLDRSPPSPALLAPDELARATRLRSREVRERFVAGRGWLRRVLGRYLEVEPGQVRFEYGDQGKPRLADGSFCFNLAHSHGLALVAVALGREVGVDLEAVRPRDRDRLAARYFSAAEVEALESVPEGQRTEAFFLCWTRKEALVKGVGKGLVLPLDRFTVSLHPGEPARLLEAADPAAELGGWSLHHLAPAPGFVAALAVEGRGCAPVCRQWPESS